jgi:hypothetical protein
MESCPMAVNASAIVSKAHTDSSNVAMTKSEELQSFDSATLPARIGVNRLNLFNRGPTYIRCCVFLI